MQQLSPIDALMLYIESPNAPNQLNPLIIYEPSSTETGVVRFKAILDNIESRLHLAPSFRRKLIFPPLSLDDPYWVDDEHFDLEFHVRHIALPKPGDWRQFCILISRLIAQRVDLSRPPWEIIVIEGLDNIEGLPPGSFAVLYKIHHACMDGVSGAELLSVLQDLSPESTGGRLAPPWQAESAPGQYSLLYRAGKKMLTRPTHTFEVLRKIFPALRAGKSIEKRSSSGLRVPHTRFNQTPSPYRVFDACFFPLSDIKKIRSLVEGATVNDVALAIVSGGLRRYLLAKNELPDGSLVAGVPVSTRSAGSAGGNEISAQTTKLFTELENPQQRLQAICSAMFDNKAYLNAVGAKELASLSTVMPGQILAYMAKTALSVSQKMGRDLLCNTIVTNVPGAQVPLYFTGAKAVKMFGGGPILLNISLTHVISSYCGEMAVNVTACRKIMPDPAFYSECIRESYQELLDAVSM
ncbi:MULTISPECIES: WS/DGAT/MGAT family O-acyltransferase [Zhongshania]|jgi:diacylglycerol O-acyltransferase|uniref:diacylglycerol O-acyltransferase n=2 Tax=Zhongshania TaxID=1434050 RepID=A0A2S4HLZ2_9GAMM|nr:wax ester/triacylglycerol synthase family O-acyltransferase [Marortus luteolus]POP54741.1 wax ester/triacylglycerol synthase family O-acyltransferase [Marortus luteolus]RNL65640.1 wax ester/triacylglycerol synthase family O-acyltransferase [Zhongshania marina]